MTRTVVAGVTGSPRNSNQPRSAPAIVFVTSAYYATNLDLPLGTWANPGAIGSKPFFTLS